MIQWTTFHLIYDYSLIFSSYILFFILFSFICAFCILKIIETLPTQLIHIFYVNNRQNHLIHLYEANAVFNSHLIRAQRAIVERTKTNTQKKKKHIFWNTLYNWYAFFGEGHTYNWEAETYTNKNHVNKWIQLHKKNILLKITKTQDLKNHGTFHSWSCKGSTNLL